MNLTELLTQWIGEDLWEKEKISPDNNVTNYLNGDKACREDLKSKIPDLIEQIEKDRQKIYSDIDYIHYNLRNAIRSEREGTNIGRYKDEVDKWLGELKTLNK